MSIDKKAILDWCDEVEKKLEPVVAPMVAEKLLKTSIKYIRALLEELKEKNQ